MIYEPLTFAELPGWAFDDHTAALTAFRQSIDHLRRIYPSLKAPEGNRGAEQARSYFETHFTPHRVIDDNGPCLFTGYYEPILKGSRKRTEQFNIPLLCRPDNLKTLVDDSLRASAGDRLTHARETANGLVPYATRQEIEEGCLDGCNLELAFLADPVDAFFLHVQGSGLLDFENGDQVRVSYAAKNGHPYTSIGQALISKGTIAAENMSLQTLSEWLRADRDRGRQMMWRNKSYIFFQELGDAASTNTTGVDSIELTPNRSLAVDVSLHSIGLPVFLAIKRLGADIGTTKFQQLMIAQDAGSAIRGAVRGDIFYGSGVRAGQQAGQTKHPGCMYVLIPHAARAT